MLYAVFRVGSATNNIGRDSVQALAAQRQVAWTAPIALGDSHRGFAVVGTTPAYFEHFRYGERLALASGRLGDGAGHGLRRGDRRRGRRAAGLSPGPAPGAEPRRRRLRLSTTMPTSPSPWSASWVHRHAGGPLGAHPAFGIEAIHIDWIAGAPMPGAKMSVEAAAAQDLTPRTVTAVLVGLKSRAAVRSRCSAGCAATATSR